MRSVYVQVVPVGPKLSLHTALNAVSNSWVFMMSLRGAIPLISSDIVLDAKCSQSGESWLKGREALKVIHAEQ